MPFAMIPQSARKSQMKVELKSRDGFVCVDLDPPTEIRENKRTWIKTLGDIAGLLTILGLGWLALTIF